MSASTYRAALVRLRDAYDLLYPYAGVCQICGHCPDKRHRLADAITDPCAAGVPADELSAEYLDPRIGPMTGSDIVLRVTVAHLAAEVERLKSRITREQAAGIERDVWADLVDNESGEAS